LKALKPQTARVLAWVCVLVIIVLSLLPGNERPHTGAPGQYEHFIAYAGTGFFFSLAYREFTHRLSIWAMLAVLSGALEALQNFVPGRSPNVLDALASTSGATIGLIAGAVSILILL
jgi:VanZ family protein